MGKLKVRQRLLSMRDRFDITDEAGNPKYYAEGALLSWGKKCTIWNAHKQEVARIEERVFSFMPTFTIYVGNKVVATIRKEFSFFTPRYNIDFGNIKVVGDPWRLNYSLESGGRTVGAINKKVFTMADTYEVDILDENLEPLILSLVLSIDYVKAQQQRK